MDIISAIDQATGCQQCGNPLERSVSDDFCGEGCQQAWHAKRTGAPLNHWLGLDIAALANSAAAGPTFPRVPLSHFQVDGAGNLHMLVMPDTRALSDAFGRMSEALARITRGMSVSATRVTEALAALTEPGETQAAQRSLMDRALEARRARNTGPASASRAPRAINPRRTR